MSVDKGAHFHRCDFQVHSPRDAQWRGTGAVTPAERESYAIEFVAACRARGLGAVAITDHHDMAFVPFVVAAARAEVDAAGNQLPDHARLNVFPGMELTLGIPCQALILFDADFPSDLFHLVLTALAIEQVDDAAERGVQAIRLERITTFQQLYAELDRHQFLKHRYIVLPNVSDSGTSTLLRSGHAGHYKDMPCVGGYLDHPVEGLGRGCVDILSGRDANYGNKPLALFQTSDCRSRDFAELGKHATWVKWATPTAEALRQACLARESRISQTRPTLPAIVVSAVGVSNSKFLGPLALNFNEQYNAIIGGRGTGKSTILEYVRWALCDEPPPLAADEGDSGDYQARRRRLIDKTLVSLAGNVQVAFTVNGVSHVVRRHSDSGKILLKIGSGPFEACSEADVRKLLPVQAYSQRQLSGVGVRVDELRRFVTAPLRRDLEQIGRQFATTSSEIRAEFGRLERLRRAERAVEDSAREMRSVNDQLQSLRELLVGVDSADQATVGLRSPVDEAANIVEDWRQQLARATEAVVDLERAISEAPSPPSAPVVKLPNGATLVLAHQRLATLFTGLRAQARDCASQLDQVESPTAPIGECLDQWERQRREFEDRYEAAKSRSNLQEATLDQLNELESRAKALHEEQGVLRAEIVVNQDASQRFADLQVQWRQLHAERAGRIREQCNSLTGLSEGLIRAHVSPASDVAPHVDAFRLLMSTTRIRTSKFDRLAAVIADEADVLSAWLAVVNELQTLLESKSVGAAAYPMLSRSGFVDADLEKMANRLTTDSVLDLCSSSG